MNITDVIIIKDKFHNTELCFHYPLLLIILDWKILQTLGLIKTKYILHSIPI